MRHTTRVLLAALLAACGSPGAVDDAGTGGGGDDAQCATPPTLPPDDPLSATRQLRRMTLALTDRMPSRERLVALAAIEEPAAQQAFLDAELDRLLSEPAFYDSMVDFGHVWISAPPVGSIADQPEYGLVQQRTISQCPAGTVHEGRWSSPNGYAEHQPCNGLDVDGNPTVVRTVEPWWAEGTTIEVVGRDGDERVTIPGPGGTTIDCGNHVGAGYQWEAHEDCGCGPHLVFCNPNAGSLHNYSAFGMNYPESNRRHAWDEPARLLAHIVWHDRPLTDLIAGTYSVGTVSLQGTYVRYGRRLSGPGTDDDDSWWRSSRWTAAHDPRHEATDPYAWSEFEVSARNPFLLADRHYRFDPRVEPSGTMRGIPAAGVLTSPGLLASWVRERVAGARALEMFACENFVPPPPSAHFAPYEGDPAAGGPCMHCHTRIDPASMHFKRFMRTGSGFDMLGIGDAHYGSAWTRAQYPYSGDPWERMSRLWGAETRMTPVPADVAEREPESRFIDFLPPEQTLYGQTSDGTVGPLGLAHMLIDSGAFDRCSVRRLHRRIVGRDIDPTSESGYLDQLVAGFLEDERRVRPFIRRLVRTDAFGRGL